VASTKITVTRGDTFNGNVASWQVLRDGAAVPLTDYEIRLYVAPTDDKDAPVIDVNESDPVGNRVYASSPASGIILDILVAEGATVTAGTLLGWMQSHQMHSLVTSTQLMIVPGYSFKIANGLVTNFHQPKSTLLLIIAAITGDKWKNIYQHAIDNQYRFLSYGDGCFFTINE
jgi:hypothetical protein